MFLKILRCQLIQALQFRIASIGAVLTQLVWGLLKIIILTSCYKHSASSNSLSLNLAQAISYVWIGQALFRFIPLQGESLLQEQILDGSIIYLLAKPVDLFAIIYWRVLGGLTIDLVTRCVPLMLVAAWISYLGYEWGLAAVPGSLGSFLLFLMVVAGSLLLSCAIVSFLTVSSFLTTSAEGINAFFPPLVLITTGIIVPLPLFPGWLQEICRWLPFAGVVDLPARVFVNQLATPDILLRLVAQGVWCVFFVVVSRGLLGMGMRKLNFQGG